MIYILIVLITILIDFVSKQYIKKNYELKKTFPLYKDKIFVKHIKNTGIAFGKFKDFQKIICVFTFIVLTVVVFVFGKSIHTNQKVKKLSLALVIGGGIGNFLDRVYNGSVTDFIAFKHEKAPIFNFADVFIWIGSLLCLLDLSIEQKKR